MIVQVAGQLGLTVLHDHNYAIPEENVSVSVCVCKYFFRIWIRGSVILNYGSGRQINYGSRSGFGSNRHIFVASESIGTVCCQIATVINHKIFIRIYNTGFVDN